MSKKVLETDFPLMVPPNPPLSVHPRFVEHGRNGSLKRAYSSEELAPLHSPSSSETSDYLSDTQGPPEYHLLTTEQYHKPEPVAKHPPFRPPTHRYRIAWPVLLIGKCCKLWLADGYCYHPSHSNPQTKAVLTWYQVQLITSCIFILFNLNISCSSFCIRHEMQYILLS